MAYTTIDDPSAYFQTALYTGNQNASVAVVNDGNSDLQPDWVWGKNRDSDSNHWVVDSSRGVTKTLFPDITNAEETQGSVNAFNTDGFTLGDWIGSTKTNEAYAAWQWKANGGTTSSNTDGSITSTVQANTTAGFSIVTYTGNGSDNATVGHGLGKIPAMMIVKNRDDSDHWGVWHQGFDAHTSYNSLSQAITTINNDDIFKAFSSTLFTLGTDSWSNTNNEKYVAYCFSEIQGYSKFGSYTGTNNADGAFVYTGFKPAWLIVKRTADAGRAWVIHDNTQDPHNVTANRLDANTSEENQSSGHFDFLSNGFKCRSTEGATNAASPYVVMAFAEHPFVSSKGVPTTAR